MINQLFLCFAFATFSLQANSDTPQTSVVPLELEVRLNDSLSLRCEVDANPENLTSIEWRKDGEVIPPQEYHDYWLLGENEEMEYFLSVASASLDNEGEYSCHAKHNEETTEEFTSATVDVIYEVTTEVEISKEIVIEEESETVQLHCNPVEGDPLNLSHVYWYHNDELVVVCGENSLDNQEKNVECKEDDVKTLALQNIDRSFSGDWKCSAENRAGVGQKSAATHLDVQYGPGAAKVEANKENHVKYGDLELLCEVDNLGNPATETFVWKQNGDLLENEHGNTLKIDDLSVRDQGNYSCQAENDIRMGTEGFFYLDIDVEPNLLQELPESLVLLDIAPQSLKCQVECKINGKLCSIEWTLNGESISDEEEKYTIENVEDDADAESNTFNSVHSTFSWNLDKYEGGNLNHDETNFTMACLVRDNDKNIVESSEAFVTLEYPPEFIDIKDNIIVEEGSFLEAISCETSGIPQPEASWFFNNEKINSDTVLQFEDAIPRSQAGEYRCKAENKHGVSESSFSLNVLYEPSCIVSYETDSNYDNLKLVCKADGNPEEIDYHWTVDGEDIEGVQHESDFSELKLANISQGNFSCFANNSVGQSTPCSISIPENFLKKIEEEDNLIIIIIIIVICSVVGIVIVAFVTAILCYKNKSQDKGNLLVNTEGSKESLEKDSLEKKSPELSFDNLQTIPEGFEE